MDYTIVPIEEKHIASFNKAVDSVAREQKFLAFLAGPSMAMTTEFVLDNIKGGWPHLVAIDNHEVIAWCDITSLHREAFAHVGTLGIGIIASHRKKGIGKELMTLALKKAKDKGLTRVELTVRENNSNAINLYQKIGFKQEGVHKNAVRVNDIYEDLFSMAILFDEK
jgi:RimJ/RimL family protein N-acetyltransferase